MFFFIAQLSAIWEMFRVRIPLPWVFLLLHLIGSQLELMYMLHILNWCHKKCKVKSCSTPWFSAAYAAAMAHRSQIFGLYQRNNYSRVGSDELLIFAKGFLKLTNPFILIKQEILSRSKNLAIAIFGKLLRVFLRKVNLLFLFSLIFLRCHLLYFVK